MRSVIKVFYVPGGAPNFIDQFYGSPGEIPKDSPGVQVLAFKRLKKRQFINGLNQVQYGWITFWGNAADPHDIIPQVFWDNGISAFQLNSILHLNFGSWSPGTFFPFTNWTEPAIN